MTTGFKPPLGVAKAAERGLELRKKASKSNKGGLTAKQASKEGIGSGVQRAVNLKNRNNISPKVIKQMVNFFNRHEKNSKIDEGKTPETDKGYQAWLLWGGDPGRSWANKIKKQLDNKAKMESVMFDEFLNKLSSENPALIESVKFAYKLVVE